VINQRISEILFFFRSNLWQLLAVTLPFALAGALLVHAFGEPMAIENETAGEVHWQSVFGLLVLYPLALGVKILGIHALASAAPLQPGALLAEALRLWPALAAISLLGALFAGSVAMLSLGVGIEVLRAAGLLGGAAAGLLVFFALPALYLYARIGTATLIAALEGQSALAALGAAWQRSQADQAVMFRVLLLLISGIVLAMLLLFGLLSSAGEEFVKSFAGDLFARGLSEWIFCLVTIALYRFWSLQQGAPRH
jgi:hypothetical protein